MTVLLVLLITGGTIALIVAAGLVLVAALVMIVRIFTDRSRSADDVRDPE